MTSETGLAAIEIVKQKLHKYIALKEHEKVKEYLRRLHKISVSSSLLQETKIDSLVRQLASHRTMNYSLTAKILLKKWYKKKLLLKPTRRTTSTEKPIDTVDNPFPAKRKLDADDVPLDELRTDRTFATPPFSESQATDDKKERKVLSLAQYLESKKHASPRPKTSNSVQKKLTDTQIEVINAQFNAATEKLAASASDLACVVNKNLEQVKQRPNQPIATTSTATKVQPRMTDLWAEEDDDEDDAPAS